MGTKTVKNHIHRNSDKFNNVKDWESFGDVSRSIAEDYLDSRLNIHIHIGFSTEEYCAVFNREGQQDCTDSPNKSSRYMRFSTDNTHGDQQVSMFIYITQNLEIPEILPIGNRIRTVARLKRINDGDYCIGHPAELTSFASLIFGDTVKDWKLISGSRDIPFGQDELPNKMVKRATEVIKYLPNEKVKPIWNGRYFVEAVDLVSRCTIDIFGDNIRIEVTEGRQLSAKYLELLCSPGKFSKGVIDGSHNKTLQKESENTQRARNTYTKGGLLMLKYKISPKLKQVATIIHRLNYRLFRFSPNKSRCLKVK